jgi:hypothetical protein
MNFLKDSFAADDTRADDISSMSADYHLQWLFIIPSGYLSSPEVEYHFQRLVVISRINHHR